MFGGKTAPLDKTLAIEASRTLWMLLKFHDETPWLKEMYLHNNNTRSRRTTNDDRA